MCFGIGGRGTRRHFAGSIHDTIDTDRQNRADKAGAHSYSVPHTRLS